MKNWGIGRNETHKMNTTDGPVTIRNIIKACGSNTCCSNMSVLVHS